jgi:hypothetical protein
MEDSEWLSQDDKNKLESLKSELAKLKTEHKKFAKNKNSITPEDKEKWKLNAKRTNQIYIEIKELRFQNVMNAGKA